MPTAFQMARRKVAGRKVNTSLKKRFEPTKLTHYAAGLGSGAVTINGIVYNSTAAVTATEVVNIGRPAAAVYAPTTGGGTVASSGGGGSVSTGGGGSTDLSPALNAPVLMVASDPNYTNERIFSPTGDFSVIDNGAGNNYVFGVVTTSNAVSSPNTILKPSGSDLILGQVTATSVVTPVIDSATHVWIKKAVGIGPATFTPAHLLHIYFASDDAGMEIESGPTSDAYLQLGKQGSTGVELRYSASTGRFVLSAGASGVYNAPAIVVNAAGKVGIGATTDPTVALQVTGAVAASTSVATPLLTTVSGDLQIAPAGVGAVKFPNATTLVSNDFDRSVILIEGWRLGEDDISGQSVFTVGKIVANELYVDIFVANETRVDRGTQLWSKSYGITTEAWTTPAIGESIRFRFEDSPALDAAIFSNNDWILFRVVDIDTGITVANVWGQVTSYANEDPTYEREQSWLFTMRAGDVGLDVPAGMLAVDLGQSGQALIELSTVDPNGAPYIKLRRWTGDNPYTPSNYITHLQIGALESLSNPYYTPNGYGIFIRPGASNSRFFVADNSVFQIRGVDLEMFNGALQTVDLSSADGSLKLGTDISNPATTTFTFDGTTGNVSIRGSLEAADATILIDADGMVIKSYNNASDYNDLNAYRFMVGGVTSGGVFGRHDAVSRAVRVSAHGNGMLFGTLALAAAGNDLETAHNVSSMVFYADDDTPANNFIQIESEGYFSVDVAGIIDLSSSSRISMSAPTEFHFDAYPASDLGPNLGTASKRWGVLYVGQIIASSVSGASMSGASWTYPGSMVINANSGSNTTLSIVNTGAGSVTVDVGGSLTVNGTAVSLANHNHDGAYVTTAALSAHAALPDVHHAKSHVLATAAGLGADHTVSGLTAGFVLQALTATTAAFAQLSHANLSNLTVGDPHTQYLLSGGDTVTGHILANPGITFDGVDLDQHVLNVNAHHNQQHVIATTSGLGPDHSATGLTAGHVLRAISSTNASFSQLLHSELGNLTVGDPHTQYILASGDAMTGVLQLISGSVGIPALTFTGDLTTGVYRSAAGTWHLTSGGANVITIAGTGATATGVFSANGALTIDSAVFAHSSHGTATNFGLQQTAAGRTIVNAPTAQTVDLAINNVVQWSSNVERLLPRSSGVLDIGDYNRQVRAAYITELKVQTLIAENVISTIGGDLVVSPTTKIVADILSTSGGIGLSTLYTSLTSHWEFDESTLPYYDSKSDAIVDSGSSLTSVVGKQGSGVAFNGSQQVYIFDNPTTLVGDIPFYISGWVYIGNDTGATRYIMFNGVSLGGERAYALYLTGGVGAMRMRFQVWNNGMTSNTTVTASTNLLINTWYFVECWHSSAANQIGVAINRTETTAAWSNGVNPDVGRVYFGSSVGGNYFTGQIDEFAFWKNYIPTATERNYLYNSGAGRSYYDIRNYLATPINFDVEHNSLRVGEYVLMKAAPGGIQQTEKFQIVSGPSVVSGGYRYTANRDLDNTSPNNWYKGDAVASLQKNAGEGYLWLTAKSSVHGHTGPGLIGYVRTGAGVDDVKPIFAKGNLRSFVDYISDEYGDAAGNDLTLTPATGFKGYTLDRTNGLRLFNTDLNIYEASTKRFEIDGDAGMNLLVDSSTTNQRQIISWYTNLDAKTPNPAAYLFVYQGGVLGASALNAVISVSSATSGVPTSISLTTGGASILLTSHPTEPAGITGTLTAAGGWTLSGGLSVVGTLQLNAYDLLNVGRLGVGTSAADGLQVCAAVAEAARGIDNVRIGITGGAPRIMFEDAGYTQWCVDNLEGTFRISTPGVLRFLLTEHGGVVLVPNVGATALYVATPPNQTASGVYIGEANLGAGHGPHITIQRNNNASTPAAGFLYMANRGGTGISLWFDQFGILRGNTTPPSSANDLAGAVIGSQTSSLDSKYILQNASAQPEEAIQHIVTAAKTALRRFTYKSGAFSHEEFEGIVTDFAPRYGMDRDEQHPAGKALNEIVLFHDLIRSVEYLYEKVQRLERQVGA